MIKKRIPKVDYKELVSELRAVGVDEAEVEARIIFCELLGITPGELYSADRSLPEAELAPIIERRRMREPLAYILGKAYFYNETYTVTPEVLIPRQDTEILVDFAVRNIKTGERLIDLCCGSGCVGISTLCNTKDTKATLVDISLGAIEVARRNAEDCGVLFRTELERCDLLTDFPGGRYEAVLSNPPYVTESEYKCLEKELYYEPRAAFIGGCDGLIFYRRIIENLDKILLPQGFCALEIGASQAEAVTKIANELGFSAEIIKDFSGHDRVAVLRYA